MMFGKLRSRPQHIWKEVKRETLGSFYYMGYDAHDCGTKYRIAVYEECLLTKETRIREIYSEYKAGQVNSKAIPYKDTWLFPGSTAHELYLLKQFDKLDKHLKEVTQWYYDLMKGK